MQRILDDIIEVDWSEKKQKHILLETRMDRIKVMLLLLGRMK